MRCRWDDIFPFDDGESSAFLADESLEDGFHAGEEDQPAGPSRTIDLKAILPASIKAIHLVGPFSDETGERAIEMFKNRGQSLPNLRGIYIDAAWKDLSGSNAETFKQYREIDWLGHNPLTELLDGQGYC